MPLKVPLESQRVESNSVRGITRLESEKNWYSIYRVFKSPAQKARQMGSSQDPSVTQSRVENSGITAAARDGMTAACPQLNLIAAFFRRSLSRERS